VLRGAEQAARFGFDSIAPDTVALCREMAPRHAELSGADLDATLDAVDRAAEIAGREGLQAGKERGARRRQALLLAAMVHRMPAEAGDEGAATRGDFLRSINAPAKVHCEALDLTEELDGWQGRIANKDG